MEPIEPDIRIRIVSAPTHAGPTWVVALIAGNELLAIGQHRRKRQAEFMALERALSRLPTGTLTHELAEAIRLRLRINRGSWLEWRLLGAFRVRTSRRRPRWAIHLRRTTPDEEAQGKDLILVTPVGEIAFQLKSTVAGVQSFLRKKRPRTAIILMHGERSSDRVLDILLHKAERYYLRSA